MGFMESSIGLYPCFVDFDPELVSGKAPATVIVKLIFIRDLTPP